MEIIKCSEDRFPALAEIWERSVIATHDFLSKEDFNKIKVALIPEYFPNVDLYALIDNERLTGFTGLSSDSIELLFIDDDCRAKDYGSRLIDFALKQGATKVDVNEQNVFALNFYQAKGFRVIGRDDIDEAGRPYPILHLSLYSNAQSRKGESVRNRQRMMAAYHCLASWTANYKRQVRNVRKSRTHILEVPECPESCTRILTNSEI